MRGSRRESLRSLGFSAVQTWTLIKTTLSGHGPDWPKMTSLKRTQTQTHSPQNLVIKNTVCQQLVVSLRHRQVAQARRSSVSPRVALPSPTCRPSLSVSVLLNPIHPAGKTHESHRGSERPAWRVDPTGAGAVSEAAAFKIQTEDQFKLSCTSGLALWNGLNSGNSGIWFFVELLMEIKRRSGSKVEKYNSVQSHLRRARAVNALIKCLD